MKTAILFFMVTSLPAVAAQERGNGGDAVVCRDSQGSISSVELLDYFEARIQRGIIAKLPPGDTPEVIAINALQPLRGFSPKLSVGYEDTILGFQENMKFVPALIDIPDSEHLAVPRDCKIEQFVVQQPIVFPEDKHFLVNEEIWKAANNTQRAGVMLHEAFYTVALEKGHSDSRNTRYFHSRMVAENVASMTDQDFSRLVELTNFPFWEFREVYQSGESGLRVRFNHNQFKFNVDGSLKSIQNRHNHMLHLRHPLVASLRSEDKYFSYSEFVTEIEFSNNARGRRIKAVLGPEWRGNGYAGFGILEQEFFLSFPSEIIAGEDGSLELSIEKGDHCYVDPRTKRSFCGKIVIEPNGEVRN